MKTKNISLKMKIEQGRETGDHLILLSNLLTLKMEIFEYLTSDRTMPEFCWELHRKTRHRSIEPQTSFLTASVIGT